MKQICLGTMITLIYQSRTRSADTIKSVCSGIFAAYGLDINTYNNGLPSHYFKRKFRSKSYLSIIKIIQIV